MRKVRLNGIVAMVKAGSSARLENRWRPPWRWDGMQSSHCSGGGRPIEGCPVHGYELPVREGSDDIESRCGSANLSTFDPDRVALQ